MKKLVTIAGLCLTALLLMSAGGRDSSGDKKVRIGIAKIVQHEALDACEQGVVDALKARGIDAVLDHQNANGDMNTAAQIANKFKSDKVDVAVGIATPIAVSLATTFTDTPVVFSAVTDPVGANLVSSLANGSGNVTGLSDAIPTGEHIALFKEIANIKTLGYIYTSSEANSISALTLVEDACKTLGLQLVTQAISTSAELRQAAEAIVNRVDGIYLTTDNTVYSALPALIQVFSAAKKPIFSGDVTAALNGGCVIASGFNYYKAGLATGNIVADILEGKKPADIPVKFLTDPSESDLLFDLDEAKNCGITIPAKYLSLANYTYENGKLNTK
ncbi:ABC transporter, substrate-binding protein [Treponema primitia ZAS-2]|uniref:ABC transporter, substrate-binding protein n=1 Tax=Treponema primitia (strain ATCC BAA-887 / DSM 12427 / ZAS-2) TaxID=545694 RepID=F5YMX3_TREPZ|nr:ABC transporter substrate-binding protein [Treponema primitia]AEF84591.1 ABC transporter, substrate-binding protein [Treponema primitia ZAS-2]